MALDSLHGHERGGLFGDDDLSRKLRAVAASVESFGVSQLGRTTPILSYIATKLERVGTTAS